MEIFQILKVILFCRSSSSGTEQSTVTMMEGLGLTKEDIRPEYLGYDDTISSMRDGRLDGGSLPAGTPVSAILTCLQVT